MLTQSEILSVSWMIFWRAIGSFILVQLIARVLTFDTFLDNNLWFIIGTTAGLTLFLFIPYGLVEPLLKKQFKGFRIQVIRDQCGSPH